MSSMSPPGRAEDHHRPAGVPEQEVPASHGAVTHHVDTPPTVSQRGHAMMRAVFTFVNSTSLGPFLVSSSSGWNVACLDSVRAIAVITVVVFHSWVLSGAPLLLIHVPLTTATIDISPIFASGAVGVDLFFVLSGFLLSQYWLKADFLGKPRPSLKKYLRHRFFRIVPGYYACLLLMLLLLCPALIPPEFVYSKLGLFLLSAHLLFVQHIFPITSGSYTVNGSLWTLTIEAMFYVMLPWAVLLFVRNRWLVSLPVLAILTLTWLYLCKHSFGPFVHFLQATVARYGVDETIIRYFLARQFPAQFVDFSLGIILANLYVQYQLKIRSDRTFLLITSRRMGTLYFIAGWIIVVWSMYLISAGGTLFGWYIGKMVVSFGFTLIMAGLLVGGHRIRSAFEFGPLRLVGLIGYSAYLWHMPIIYLVNKYPGIIALSPSQRFPHVLLHASFAVFVLSVFFFLVVEKPFLLYGRRDSVQRNQSDVQHDPGDSRPLDPVSDRETVGTARANSW